MATIQGSTNNSNWTFKLEVSEGNYDIASNSSPVTVNVYLGRTSSTSYIGGNWSGNITVDGSNKGISGSIPYPTYVNGKEYMLLASETFTVYHNDDGSKNASVSASMSSSSFTPSYASASGSVPLSKIPRKANLTDAPNFNDESNPTIKYSNPAGNSVTSLQACISLTGSTDDIKYRDVGKTNSSYTFNLTENERDVLRQATPNGNSLSVIFYLKTELGSTTYYSTLNKTMTIVNGNPTFSDFTYRDSNSDVTSITGNNQILVKGLSTLVATISSTNKMIANKKATAKNYLATIDNKNVSTDYSANDLNIDLGVINVIGTQRLNVRAYDTRNNSTLVYKEIAVYDYNKPIINATINRLNNFEKQTTLKIDGTYTKLTINGVDKNVLTNLQYRYRENGGTWSSWKNLTSTISDGKFTCTDVVLSLDNTKSFEFEIQAIDKLQTSILTLQLDVGQAIFFISSNKKECYINGHIIPYFTEEEEWEE